MNIQVFVFGTLRVEAHRWARDAEVADPIVNCTARGTMYDYHGAYPYVHFGGVGIVYGDVLTFDEDHEAYQNMCRVEIGAGYVLRDIEVVTPDKDLLVVKGWDVAPHAIKRMAELPVVPSGDWLIQKRDRDRAYL